MLFIRTFSTILDICHAKVPNIMAETPLVSAIWAPARAFTVKALKCPHFIISPVITTSHSTVWAKQHSTAKSVTSDLCSSGVTRVPMQA